MHIAELWRYPVKSMGGERLAETPVGVQGIPGDRGIYVVDDRDGILSARTKPGLLRNRATVDPTGEVLVDGRPWRSPEVGAAVREAAGPGARLVAADGPERFDILPLLVLTDGALAAYGHDHRRLRPNVVIGGVSGLAERGWEGRQLAVGEAVIGLADLRGRCVMTTFDPDTAEPDLEPFLHVRRAFGGTFALNAWAGRDGRIAVGDEVRLLDEHEALAVPERGRYG
ncbi:MAG: MOSC N-terminal beta barrel domain-containing protein [Solirubrobacterales bacterium]|nr:MOSC N-terminal beta barrel domain-containing protein [Solirubrobacterales bacterium]